jgi:Tfp pilus assembly protein PilZ
LPLLWGRREAAEEATVLLSIPSLPGGHRLFVRTKEAGDFLADLEHPRGRFVPSRLMFAIGDQVALALQLPQASRPIELPTVVVGRRAPHGAGGQLKPGVILRLNHYLHPNVALLRDVLDGRVVDLEQRLRTTGVRKVNAVFSSTGEMCAELSHMLEGGAALLPTDRVVRPGDRVRVEALVEGDIAAVSFVAKVRGVVHSDDNHHFRATLDDEEGREHVRHFAELLRAAG